MHIKTNIQSFTFKILHSKFSLKLKIQNIIINQIELELNKIIFILQKILQFSKCSRACALPYMSGNGNYAGCDYISAYTRRIVVTDVTI